jgi:hypothetical protein
MKSFNIIFDALLSAKTATTKRRLTMINVSRKQDKRDEALIKLEGLQVSRIKTDKLIDW